VNDLLGVFKSRCLCLGQILSENLLKAYGKDIINIHHGLLPSFKGGNPSRQVSQFCMVSTFFLSFFFFLLKKYD
jgi:hypothetical protein